MLERPAMAEVDLGEERFERYREAGDIVATVMNEARDRVEVGTPQLEVAEFAESRTEELGGKPADLREVPRPRVSLDGWEEVARRREVEEIEWYERALEGDALDAEARAIAEEILESEHHHRRELGGKWMSA